MRCIIISLTLLLIVSCKNEVPQEKNQLGIIDFEFTGNEEAQKAFKKGLLLMHNFEYADSRAQFILAQEKDPNMAMAYWGEAMTYNQPLWRQQYLDEGNEALAKLAKDKKSRLAKCKTEIEKDWMDGVEILFGEGDKKEKDVVYNKHMERLYKKYPEDHEVAAFYALSCLGAVPSGRDVEAYEKGAAIVQGIIDENPSHPGALHYLIHSYDDPDHATLALDAANAYSKVAADAAHALHMPSHIYVAVGMWDEVISSNIASWEASIKRKEEKELGQNDRGYHSLHWLMYGYLQRGQYDKAAELMREMDSYLNDEANKRSRSYVVSMKGNYLAETEDWLGEFKNFSKSYDDLNIRAIAKMAFVDGMQAFKENDLSSLKQIRMDLGSKRVTAETMVSETGTPMCATSGASRWTANKSDIDRTKIFESQLDALIHWNSDEAETYLQSAANLEHESSYSFGPPDVIIPSNELYGKWLSENDRFKEAKVQYLAALKRGPKRLKVLTALHSICTQLQESDEAAEYLTHIKNVATHMDSRISEQLDLSEAKHM